MGGVLEAGAAAAALVAGGAADLLGGVGARDVELEVRVGLVGLGRRSRSPSCRCPGGRWCSGRPSRCVVKITSSWRFAGRIWLTFSEGFAMSRMGRLRTDLREAGLDLARASPRGASLSAKSSACAFSASTLFFSRAASLSVAACCSARTASSFSRYSSNCCSSSSRWAFFLLRAALPLVRGLLVLVAGHVDLGLGEAVVLVDGVPLAPQPLRARCGPRGSRRRAPPPPSAPLASCASRASRFFASTFAPRLLDLLLGELHVELVELDLVLLPLAVVVDEDHPGEGEEQADGGEGEDEVQLPRPRRPSRDRDRVRP